MMMVRIPMIGLILALLAVAYILARIFSRHSSRGPSVWHVAGQFFRVVVLGLLIFGGLAIASYFGASQHVAARRVAILKAEMAAAKARVQQAEASIDEAWDRMNRSRIPINGAEAGASEVGAAHAAAAEQLTKLYSYRGENVVVVGHQRTAERDPDADELDADSASSASSDREQKTEQTEQEKPTEQESETLTDPATEPIPAAADLERPDWVDHPPKRVGNTQRQVIRSESYRTIDECYRYDLNDKLIRAVQLRISEIAGNSGAEIGARGISWSASLNQMPIGLDFIRREICQDEYVETVEFDFAPMKQVHLLLEFDPSVDQELRAFGQRNVLHERVRVVIAAAILGLLLLSLVYGLLKLDTWTRGYYSKRLFLGVPAAILALLALLAVWTNA